jgi:membrane associated rhomboid family serine protease
MRPSRRQLLPFTRPWSAGRPSATAVLLAIHLGAFASQLIVELMIGDGGGRHLLWQWLALDGGGVQSGHYWKFFSFQFLHDGALHLLGNMLLLYFAGREVEPIVGARHFVAIYVLGNLVGGFAHWAAMPEVPIVGVSAGVAAVLVAFSTILPELEVTLNLFFILPVRLRAKHLALALVAGSGLLWYGGSALTIGPAAILIACLPAWIYVKQLGFGNPLAIQRYIFEKRQRAARLDRMSAEQFVSAEIDPILDKIATHGMHSLTRAERRILDKGREKIAAKTTRKV